MNAAAPLAELLRPGAGPADWRLYDPSGALRLALWAAAVVGIVIAVLATVVTLPVAAVASGKLIAQGQRKPVQHLEGGIVEQVMVREGQAVRAGELLIRLEATRSRATESALAQRLVHLRALGTRLAAEESRAAFIDFPPDLREQAASVQALDALATQAELFKGRRRTLEERLTGIDATTREMGVQLVALDRQIETVRKQIEISRVELADYRGLFEQGYGLKVRVLDLERRMEGLEGMIAQAMAEKAAAQARIAQLQLDRTRLMQDYADSASAKRAEVDVELADLKQRLAVASDVQSRVEVRAPLAGTVYQLRSMAVGAVISPGDTLLEIVPEGVDLVAEVQIDPSDVEELSTGDPAVLRFTSRGRRDTVEVPGEVTMLSRDRVEEPSTRRAYYPVHVALHPDDKDRAFVQELRAGVPVEAYIVRGERSLVGLLLQPLTNGLVRTLRER